MKSLLYSLAIALLTPSLLFAQDPNQKIDVWTWHNDNGRTGQNAAESALKLNNVNKQSFGQLCHASVDGQVYAQPLVMWDSMNNRNLVYVVTQNDSIYTARTFHRTKPTPLA